MEEIWVVIQDFPGYKISNYGNVVNDRTGRQLKLSQTRGGVVKVGLVEGYTQYSRSVSGLVARAFVSGRDDIFNTPIHLDGDPTNNVATNLMWRPRWFAHLYVHQLREESELDEKGPLFDVASGVVYPTILNVVTTQGVLRKDVWKSLVYKTSVFPTGQFFKFVK